MSEDRWITPRRVLLLMGVSLLLGMDIAFVIFGVLGVHL
jgi:hypothetical protein